MAVIPQAVANTLAFDELEIAFAEPESDWTESAGDELVKVILEDAGASPVSTVEEEEIEADVAADGVIGVFRSLPNDT